MKLPDAILRHPIWARSVDGLTHRYGRLTWGDIENRITRMKRCDDLTLQERELLTLLEVFVAEHKPNPGRVL